LWPVDIALVVAGFQFDGRDTQSLAEVDRGVVKRKPSCSHPEIELVAGLSALEAAKEAAFGLDREAACVMLAEWAWTTPLTACDIATRRIVKKKLKYLADCDLCPYR